MRSPITGRAIRLAPGNADYHHRRGYARSRAGDDRRGRSPISAGRSRSIRSAPGSWQARGDMYGLQGDWNRAIAQYNQAILRGTNRHGSAYADRGYARMQLRQDAKALGDLDRAIRLDPEDGDSLYNRGLIRFERRQYGLAEADFGRAIALMPQDAEPLYRRGLIRLIGRRFDEALDDLDLAMRIDDQVAHYRYGRGMAAVRGRAGRGGRGGYGGGGGERAGGGGGFRGDGVGGLGHSFRANQFPSYRRRPVSSIQAVSLCRAGSRPTPG